MKKTLKSTTLLLLASCGKLAATQENSIQPFVTAHNEIQSQAIIIKELTSQQSTKDKYIKEKDLELQNKIKQNDDLINELVNRDDTISKKDKEIQEKENKIQSQAKRIQQMQYILSLRKPADKKIYASWLSAAGSGENKKLDELARDYNINANYTNGQGNNALLVAAGNGKNHTIDLLVNKHKVDINNINNNGNNALLVAACNGHNHTIDLLTTKYGADINYTNNNNYNVLLFAAGNGHTHTVDFLLKNYKIDINHRNNKGKTALDLTKEKKHQVTIDLLVNKGGKTGEELAKK